MATVACGEQQRTLQSRWNELDGDRVVQQAWILEIVDDNEALGVSSQILARHTEADVLRFHVIGVKEQSPDSGESRTQWFRTVQPEHPIGKLVPTAVGVLDSKLSLPESTHAHQANRKPDITIRREGRVDLGQFHLAPHEFSVARKGNMENRRKGAI